MTPLPANTGAGSFTIKDPQWIRKTALLVLSATVQYLYMTEEDAFVQIPNMALAGTFGAGVCWGWSLRSNTITANGGTTWKITTTTLINKLCIGRKVRFLTGSNVGKEVTVTWINIVAGGTNEIIFSETLASPVANTDTFAVDTWLFLVLNAGTIASWSFKSYDPLTWVVTTLSNTGLPATWGTDGRIVCTPSYFGAYATGTASVGGASTLTCAGKTWTADQWRNYQVRITSGTGIWQVRNIASNTPTQLTTSTAWTIQPDATSVFNIEANDDNVYLLGNNAVTMYKYIRSTNTWSTMAPTTARASALVTWWGANWVWKSWDTKWADESSILDGRYIISFRGGWSSAVDRFDIAGGTAWAWAWASITYSNASETFTTWSSYDVNWDQVIIRKDATHRYFKFDVVCNTIQALTTLLYPDSTAVVWDKIFTVTLKDGVDEIDWLYSIQNTWPAMHRIMLF